MESRIVFLIILLLALWLMFSKTGRGYIKFFLGIDLQPTSKDALNDTPETNPKSWGDYPSNKPSGSYAKVVR